MSMQFPAPRTIRSRVFISHASEDKDAFVGPLCEELQRRTVDAWLDRERLTPGMSLSQELNRGVEEADGVVIILSPRYRQKFWTQFEFDSALRAGKRFFIVLLGLQKEDEQLTGIPLEDLVHMTVPPESVISVADGIMKALSQRVLIEPAKLDRQPSTSRWFLWSLPLLALVAIGVLASQSGWLRSIAQRNRDQPIPSPTPIVKASPQEIPATTPLPKVESRPIGGAPRTPPVTQVASKQTWAVQIGFGTAFSTDKTTAEERKKNIDAELQKLKLPLSKVLPQQGKFSLVAGRYPDKNSADQLLAQFKDPQSALGRAVKGKNWFGANPMSPPLKVIDVETTFGQIDY